MIVWQAPQLKKSSALLIIDPETMEEVRKFALNAIEFLNVCETARISFL